MQRSKFRRPSLGGILILAVIAWLLIAFLPTTVKAAIGDVASWPDLKGVDLWRITSAGDLVPGTTGTRDIGSSTLRVDAIYANDLDLGDDVTLSGDATIAALTVTGAAALNGNTTLGNAGSDSVTITGHLYANDDIDLGNGSDDIALGSGATDLIAVNGRIESNVLPEQTDNYNLGSNVARWSNVWSQFVRTDQLYLTTPTTANSSPVAVSANDQVILYTGTGGAVTVNLPAASALAGKTLIVKDAGGDATANNITVDGNLAETIDGAATQAITANYGVMRLYCNGTAWFTW